MSDCEICEQSRTTGYSGGAAHCRHCHRTWTSRQEAHCTAVLPDRSRCCAHFNSNAVADECWCEGRTRDLQGHRPWCDGNHGRPWEPRHVVPEQVKGLELVDRVWVQAGTQPTRSRQFSPAKAGSGQRDQTGAA